MENKVQKVKFALEEIQNSNASMEKRIEKLTAYNITGHNDCSCKHNFSEMQTEIAALTSQYHKLESKVNEKSKALGQLNEDTVRLKERLDVLEIKLRIQADYNCVDNDQRDSVLSTGKQSATKIETQMTKGIHGPSTTQTNTKSSRTNFLKDNDFSSCIVKQEVKTVYDGEKHWRFVANMERQRNQQIYLELRDLHVVICVDTSESMTELNGWEKARTFMNDYLKGLESMSTFPDYTPEHVAVVVFGHETRILVEYSTRYDEIRKKLDATKIGGPTQMYGGLLLADAVAFCTKRHIEECRNGTLILTKIIIVTDGRVTEADLVAGPDVHDSSKIDETKAKILQGMEDFRRTQRDVFFVPVGNLDLDFINTMAACSDGMLVDFKHGTRFARRQFLTKQLLDPIGMISDSLTVGSDHDLSEEDKEDMRNIQERGKRFIAGRTVVVDGSSNMYEERNSSQLPSVGCRVRRGPDWHFGNQDANGPGTVIGHDEDGYQIWCEWDENGERNIYPYGPSSYGVLVVDEARILKQGEVIAVGCQVIPGKDWKSSDGITDTGVVIRLNKQKKSVLVRWNNGRRGSYSYGVGGKQEVRVKTCDSVKNSQRKLPMSTQKKRSTSSEWEAPAAMSIEEFEVKQKNKNKNKNKNIL